MKSLLGLTLSLGTLSEANWRVPIENGSYYARRTQGHYPFLIQNALNQWFSWDPQDLLSPLSDVCSKTKLESQLLASTSHKAWNQVFAEYGKTCGQEAFQEFGPTWMGSLRLFAMEYGIGQNPLMKRMLFNLPNGQVLKGLLVIRDLKPRPFVILRMGITGGIEEAFAERYFYHHLFERGFSNFLMVENMTSSDFVENNKRPDFGGIHEAFQNIWLAQNLRNPNEPLSKLITSLHLMGISLGGQGVLTTAWLQPVQTNPHLYQSILGLCPLVDMPATFERLFKKDILRYPLEFWARARFASIKSLHPELFDWNQGVGLIGRLLEVAKNDFKMPDAYKWRVNIPQFMKANSNFNFLHSLSNWNPQQRSSIQIWSTNQDRIVAADLNSAVLPGVSPLFIEQGHHCSFPIHWHPHVTQALLNAHILKSAPVRLENEFRSFKANEAKDWQFKDVVTLDKKNVELIFHSASLLQTINYTTTPSAFDFNFEGRDIGPWELKLLKRWISTNLKIEGFKNSQVTVSWPTVKPNTISKISPNGEDMKSWKK
jgi:hypothetical protein